MTPTHASEAELEPDQFHGHDAGVAASTPEPSLPAPGLDIPLDHQCARHKPRGGKIPVLSALSRTLRHIGYTNILYGMRLRGPFPSRLIASPSDIWAGDADVGQAMASGIFRHKDFEVTGEIPDFTDLDAPADFRAWLHSFIWLRDLAALNDTRKARAIAEPSLKEWLEHYSRWDAVAWRPDVTGQRLMAFINHAPLVLASGDLVYRSKVLNAMAQQGRHLARTLDMANPGLARIKAATGLVFSSLLLPGGEGRTKVGTRCLEVETERYLLADGMPESRDPRDLVGFLQLMITLRDGYRAARTTPPTYLQVQIDKSAAMLRAFHLPGNGLAAFNGSRQGAARAIAHCLDMSESQAQAMLNGRHGGYQRMEQASSIVVMDCGPPPKGTLSRAAHASVLSFEYMADGHPLVVNCGAVDEIDRNQAVPPEALRATAAHSTVVVNDTNSAQIQNDGTIGRCSKIIEYGRADTVSGTTVRALSEGYAKRHALTHSRALNLSPCGQFLFGEDILSTTHGRAPRSKTAVLRFHLHPAISAAVTGEDTGVLLRHSSGAWWMFRCDHGHLSLEDSVHVTAPDGRPARTQQIVVTAELEDAQQSFAWSFARG